MSMTPEEKFNQQVWEILQRIKEDYIATETGKPIEYEFPRVQGVGIIPKKRRRDIFYKLQEWKAIQILDESIVGSSTPLLKYQVLEPKFDEIYEKFQKACDLTSYLNDYQNSQLKGADLPEFGHLRKGNQPQQTAQSKHKGRMFETGSGGGYYNRSHPIRPIKKLSAKEIVDGFSSSNYAFVLMMSEGILSASEFGSEGEASYQLQSAPGQMLLRERQLLSKFENLGLLRHLGEDGIFAIAKLKGVDTTTLGQIVNEIKNRQAKDREKSSDLKDKYNQLIEEIRNPDKSTSNRLDLEERYQKIISELKSDTATRRGIEKKWDVLQAIWSVYESNSRPESIFVPVARLTIKNRSVELIDGIIEGLKKIGVFQKWDRKDRHYNIEFINHELLPKIYQEVGDTYKKLAEDYQQRKANNTKHNESNVAEVQEKAVHSLPAGWELGETDNIPQIVKDGTVVFTFPNNWANKYKYFKCLWENYGDKKDYKDVYEFESKSNYPDRGVWRTNRNIRNTINKLRKELESKNLLIHIETNKGFTLTIS